MSDPNWNGDGGHGPKRRGDGGPGATPDGGSGRDPLDESDRIANEERRRNAVFASGLVAVLGAWVALSILVFEVSQAAFWNNAAAGVVIFLGGGYNYYRQYNDVPLSVGVAVLVSILGIWLVIAAPAFEMRMAPFSSTFVSGLLIAGLAGYDAYESREARAVTTDSETGAS